MAPDTYQSIDHPSEGLYKEKGSKFISFAFPVQNEETIKDILAGIRKEHFSARHCCYAWSLGIGQERYRVNDDGEPSGTAGRPIFGQIQSHQLTNILLVVVRYFGGTLLGVSGLIQAYKQAASDAISNTMIITRTVEHILEIKFDYAAMNNLMQLIKEEQLEIVTTHFDLQCTIQIKVRSTRLEDVESKIAKIEGYQGLKIVQE
ncbi:MAG: YigZ family protein [Bacteroidia bacterium]|nr:YigZ family protein [Bacteroidia bacterium]